MLSIGHDGLVSDNSDSELAYFQDRGFEVRLEERDLHAEYMASGEPGRASFFEEHRHYFCVDLLRDGGLVARHYADGVTAADALREAKRRHSTEQGSGR